MPIDPVSATLMAAGTAYSIFGGRKKINTPDIGAELARIRATIDAAREQAKIAINREAAVSRRSIASNLAARGVYRSPVSALPFESLEGERIGAIARSDASLLGAGAQLQAQSLNNFLGLNVQAHAQNAEFAAQRRAGIASLLTSAGGALYQMRPGQSATPASSFFSPNPSYGGANINPYAPNQGSQFNYLIEPAYRRPMRFFQGG